MTYGLWSGADAAYITTVVNEGTEGEYTVTIDYRLLTFTYTPNIDLTVADASTLTIAAGQTLVIPQGKTLTVAGTLNVNGTLDATAGALNTSGTGTVNVDVNSVINGYKFEQAATGLKVATATTGQELSTALSNDYSNTVVFVKSAISVGSDLLYVSKPGVKLIGLNTGDAQASIDKPIVINAESVEINNLKIAYTAGSGTPKKNGISIVANKATIKNNTIVDSNTNLQGNGISVFPIGDSPVITINGNHIGPAQDTDANWASVGIVVSTSLSLSGYTDLLLGSGISEATTSASIGTTDIDATYRTANIFTNCQVDYSHSNYLSGTKVVYRVYGSGVCDFKADGSHVAGTYVININEDGQTLAASETYTLGNGNDTVEFIVKGNLTVATEASLEIAKNATLTVEGTLTVAGTLTIAEGGTVTDADAIVIDDGTVDDQNS
jgi:hypothetical protein